MSSIAQCDGSLYVETTDGWTSAYCWIRAGKFQAFKKEEVVSVSQKETKREAIVENSSVRDIDPAPAVLQRILLQAGTNLPQKPFFFEVTADEGVFSLACDSDKDREKWLLVIEAITSETGRSGRAKSIFGNEQNNEKSFRKNINIATRHTLQRIESLSIDRGATKAESEEEEDDTDYDYCCRNSKIFRLKIDTLSRLVKVVLAFPFVIVVATLNLSPTYSFLRTSTFAIRMMNMLIYVVPFIFVDVLLSRIKSVIWQRIFIGIYIAIYLIPVGYVVVQKLRVASSTSKIEEGTFCFKPARAIRLTFPNVFAIQGFVLEWVQHCLYCFPLGILANEDASTVEDMPPYIKFKFYFWLAVGCVFLCGLILVLNAVLRGKTHYKFSNIGLLWLFLFTVGGPGFVSVVTILFMGLWCDNNVDPPVLVQFVGRGHIHSLAMFLVQMTLLPSGTYKETMRNDELDIMFVPVYLQAHFLMKAIFCGVYVSFYTDDWSRIVILTVINIILLFLNSYMKPCSVNIINVLRDTVFICASLAGVQSLNYIGNRQYYGGEVENTSTKTLFLTMFATNVTFVCIGMIGYYTYTVRSVKFQIARTFLDLEWQVSKGGAVHPRVLEPLISLTLSRNSNDTAIAKSHIEQLVWLISYPNMRVQFQSAWGIANLALVDEDARQKIHAFGGTKSLFEWYMDMDFVVQLEALAALVNLTLSTDISKDMVERYKCIPFFISLTSGTKLKHAQFAAIALGNLARVEYFRELIRKNAGIPVLVGCIMASDYQKRRYGALALANMALSVSQEIVQIFESKGLIDRIIKMAVRREPENQREVMALIRNLSCHARLRPILLERGVAEALKAAQSSVYPSVVEWSEEILRLMERDHDVDTVAHDRNPVSLRMARFGHIDKESQADVDLLQKMTPLEASVTWSTWGSKLESIFSTIFSTMPTLQSSQVTAKVNTPLEIYLATGVSKASLKRWRDSLTYIVTEKPSHGRLSDYTTSSDYVTYMPNDGYIGADFFTYRLQLGSLSTPLATVAITVDNKGGRGVNGATRPNNFTRTENASISHMPNNHLNYARTGSDSPSTPTSSVPSGSARSKYSDASRML